MSSIDFPICRRPEVNRLPADLICPRLRSVSRLVEVFDLSVSEDTIFESFSGPQPLRNAAASPAGCTFLPTKSLDFDCLELNEILTVSKGVPLVLLYQLFFIMSSIVCGRHYTNN